MSIYGAGGAGGGKGKAGGAFRKSTEAKDNLDSTAYAKIVEILSEGEIEGFATPSRLALTPGTTQYMNASMKDIYFNKTRLLNVTADNTLPQDTDFNFKNVTVVTKFGTQSQAYVPGFDAVEEEISVNQDVILSTPVVKTITDTNVNAVRLTLSVPLLQKLLDNGDIVGTSLSLAIAVRYFGGSYTTVINDTISGRTSDLYQRDYIVDLAGAFPVDIRVSRTSAEPTSIKETNAFSWSSYTELIYKKLKYPNTAYVATRIDAEQFSNIPERTYKIRGIKVAIPSNATVDLETGRLTYAGIWNGTFGAAKWTTDPAWILWDLLTSQRYGLGDHIQPNTLDKWAFFQASKYCAELVSTGLNDPISEPRFSCNVNIQTQEEAYKLINDMCSVFRAMPYWAAGSLSMMQDRPSDPVALFSLSNVSEEGFTYESSSLKTRSTVVVVGWLNLELGDIDREVVEDPEGIARYGVVTKEVTAFATTSRSQAHRVGEWILYSERYETEVCNFTTSLENGIIVRPGAVINIADPVKAGARRAGRISAATASTVTVDDATDLPSTGTLSVVLDDGIVESRTITDLTAGVYTVTPAFSAAPQNGGAWMVEADDIQPTQWKVLGLQEQDGINYTVTAVSYNSSKYDYVERGAPLETRDITNLNVPPETPQDLTGTEILYPLNGRVTTKLALTWKAVRGVNEYRIRWRSEFGNWTEARKYGPLYEIEDVSAGNYQVEVYSISATQIISSAPAEMMFNITGVGAPPVDVTGVTLVPINESTAIIQWNLATDLDVLIGGEVLIRHDPNDVATAEWANSNAIVQAAAGNQTQKQVPLLPGTYFIAFRDQSGNRSNTPTPVAAILPTPQPRLVVKTWAEELENPKFNGVSENLGYDVALDGLYLDPTVGLTGHYVYEKTLNLGGVYDVNLRRRVVSTPIAPGGLLFDDAIGLFDDQPGDFDGDNLDFVNAVTYVRTSNESTADALLTEDGSRLLTEDGYLLILNILNAILTEDDDILLLETGDAFVTEELEFTQWNEYANALVRGRVIQLKVEGTTESSQAGLLVTELGATAELQQRIEQGGPYFDGGSGTISITFADAFYATPVVTVIPYDLNSNDSITISNVSRTGFDLDIQHGGSAQNHTFIYTATGYGKEIP
jgi:predicted phage tail protein